MPPPLSGPAGGDSPGVLYVCGVPGTGKTACCMEVLGGVRQQAQASGVQVRAPATQTLCPMPEPPGTPCAPARLSGMIGWLPPWPLFCLYLTTNQPQRPVPLTAPPPRCPFPSVPLLTCSW